MHSLNRVTLDGSGSYDPDGKKIDYSWLQLAGGPIVSLSNNNSVKPTFEAPQVAESTTLTFQLIVNNNDAVSSPRWCIHAFKFFFRNILNFIESRAILEMKSHSEESHEFVYLKN